MKDRTFHLQACIGFSDKREQVHSMQIQIIGEGIVYRYIHFLEKKYILCRNSPQIFVIICEANHNFIFKEVGCVVRKVNDVSLNRQFVETDDEEEAGQLLSLLVNAYRKTVFDAVESKKGNQPVTVVDPDAITNETFTKAFYKRKHIGEPEKLVEWLKRVAENLMIDAIRRSRQKRRLPSTSLDGLSVSEGEALYASRRAETDAAQTEAYRYREEQLLRLLTYMDKDREIVLLARDERINPAQIAERVGSTAGAIQKRQGRFIKWTNPVMQHLDALIDCLPNKKDRNVMERYFLDTQSFSEITEALGISRATIEETVERVIKDWQKAAKDNPTDPVSAMVKKEK